MVARFGVQLSDVARPHDGGQRVAVLKVLLVRVALDVPDLAVAHLLLQHIDRRRELRVAPLAVDLRSQVLHDAAHGVAHFGKHPDAALQGRIPQVGNRGESTREVVLVPGDSGEPALPRERVLASRVEGNIEQLRYQVLFVRDHRVVEFLRVSEADPAVHHPVGEAHGVAADVLTELQLVLDLAVVGVVVIDGLGVGGLDSGLLLERLKCRVVTVAVDIQVERPVVPAHDLVGVGLVFRGLGAGRAARRATRRARGESERSCADARALQHVAPRELRTLSLDDEAANERIFGKWFGHDGTTPYNWCKSGRGHQCSAWVDTATSKPKRTPERCRNNDISLEISRNQYLFAQKLCGIHCHGRVM